MHLGLTVYRRLSVSDLSEDDYHTVSDAAMDRMVEYFEDIGDEHEIPGYDVEYQVSSCKKVCPPILTNTYVFLNQYLRVLFSGSRKYQEQSKFESTQNESLINAYTHRVES